MKCKDIEAARRLIAQFEDRADGRHNSTAFPTRTQELKSVEPEQPNNLPCVLNADEIMERARRAVGIEVEINVQEIFLGEERVWHQEPEHSLASASATSERPWDFSTTIARILAERFPNRDDRPPFFQPFPRSLSGGAIASQPARPVEPQFRHCWQKCEIGDWCNDVERMPFSLQRCRVPSPRAPRQDYYNPSARLCNYTMEVWEFERCAFGGVRQLWRRIS